MLESGLAVITACLPTLNTLFGIQDLLKLLRDIKSSVSGFSLRTLVTRTGSHDGTIFSTPRDMENAGAATIDMRNKTSQTYLTVAHMSNPMRHATGVQTSISGEQNFHEVPDDDRIYVKDDFRYCNRSRQDGINRGQSESGSSE